MSEVFSTGEEAQDGSSRCELLAPALSSGRCAPIKFTPLMIRAQHWADLGHRDFTGHLN